MPLSFIDDLLYRRDDFTRSQSKEVLEACGDRIDEVMKGAGEEVKGTIFSKLPTPEDRKKAKEAKK